MIVIFINLQHAPLTKLKFRSLTLITQVHFYCSFLHLFRPSLPLLFINVDSFLPFLSMSICITVLFHFIAKELQPQSIVQIKDAFSQAYHNSTLDHVDTDHLNIQLTQLMDEEQVFLDQDLDLKKLDRLSINKHQLSEFLNAHKGSNFNAFVNEYRIRYSKQLLIKHPEYTTLAVGFMSSFNSYSTYNHSFKKFEGCSPNDYRSKSH